MALEIGLCGLTLAGIGVGSWSIYWAKGHPHPGRSLWGRRLFLATFLVLGLVAFPAAYLQAQHLPALGLCLGLLVVAMLWESPAGWEATDEAHRSPGKEISGHRTEESDHGQRHLPSRSTSEKPELVRTAA